MKIINYIMIFFIVFANLYSIDKGYYIYKFGIDSNDSISLYNSKFIDAKLKVAKVDKHIHNPILYKLINTENNILFEGGLINPKIVYYEEMIDDPHTKSTFILDSAYFIIKVPVFDNVDKIEFFRSQGNSENIEKLSEIKLNDK